MSAEAVGWVYRFSPYDGATFQVHHAIADSVSDQHGYVFWMRQAVCAAKARVSRRAVNTAIRRMLEDGLLVLVEDRPGGANRYAFVMPAGLPAQFDGSIPTTRAEVSPVVTPSADAGEEPLQDKGASALNSGGVITVRTPTFDHPQPPVGENTVHTGCEPSAHQVSPTITGGVTVGYTYPKRTQEISQTSSSAPRDNEPAASTSGEEEDLIEAAFRLLADRRLRRREGGPIQSLDRWTAATLSGLRRQHGDRAALLVADEPGHTPETLADTLEPDATAVGAQRAARALADRDRSCPLCGGGGMRFDETLNVAVRCEHGGAA